MPTTLQPVTSRTVLDFRGQETVQIEGRSCLTVAFKEHQKALGEFKSNPNAYPLAQMIVAWARYAERFLEVNGYPLTHTATGDLWKESGEALIALTTKSFDGTNRFSLKQGILGVMQSQGIDTDNL